MLHFERGSAELFAWFWAKPAALVCDEPYWQHANRGTNAPTNDAQSSSSQTVGDLQQGQSAVTASELFEELKRVLPRLLRAEKLGTVQIRGQVDHL